LSSSRSKSAVPTSIITSIRPSCRPGVRLGLPFVKHGTKTPSLRKLRQTVEAWAANAGEIDPAAPPSRIIEIDDWQIEFFLFSGFATDGAPKGAIAGALDTGRIVNPKSKFAKHST